MTGSYVDSMPREAMSAVEQFPVTGGAFFLPRAVAAVPETLAQKVFQEVEQNLEAFQRGEFEQDIAGVAFLSALRTMRRILLQDAAQIRRSYQLHPMFLHPLFQTPLYTGYEASALQACQEEAPINQRLQLAM
ncbi:hypothetical protein PsorP6_015571 [Peronosclerospora sorghi]|uniref:Uncharacterized protein n=1 Tax=Peronosclerospora sorghi TaxID=230839 RepID=A0ACC0WNU2_9STRA|nr:hypothetical protein PsorP6_015571 [Peronosclerospora sorghi]